MTLDKSAARIRQMFAQIAAALRPAEPPALAGDRPALAAADGPSWRRRATRRHGFSTFARGRPTWRWPIGGAAARGCGSSARDFCRPMLAIARPEVPPRRGRARIAPGRGRRPAVALRRRTVRPRLRGLRAAEPERPRRRAAGDGPRLPARRAGGGAGVLHARRRPLAALYRWYFRRVLPRVGQTLARNRQGAYNYLPASVGQFPQGEAMRRADAGGRPGRGLQSTRSPWDLHAVYRQKICRRRTRGNAL